MSRKTKKKIGIMKNTKLWIQPTPEMKDVYEDNRRLTYKCWCGLLLLIFTIWMGSCYYVIYYGYDAHIVEYYGAEVLEDALGSRVYLSYIKLFFYISVIITLVNLIPVKVYQKFSTNYFLMVFMGLVILFIIVYIGLYFIVDPDKYKNIMFWIVPETITILVGILSTYIAALCNDISTTSNVLKRICRFYIFYRHLITFGLFILMSILYLENFTIKMCDQLGLKDILFYMILGGSCYIILFIFYFGAFVISATVATYYWTQYDEQCPVKSFFHAVISVIKYHLGAVCFNATAVLPPLVAAYAILKSDIYIVRDYSFVLSTISVAEHSAKTKNIKTIYNAKKSSFIRIPMTNNQPMSRLRGVQLIWIILSVVLLSTNIIMVLLRWEKYLDENRDSYWALIISYSNIISLWLPFILMVDIVMDSIIIHLMEKECENEDTSYQKLLDISE